MTATPTEMTPSAVTDCLEEARCVAGEVEAAYDPIYPNARSGVLNVIAGMQRVRDKADTALRVVVTKAIRSDDIPPEMIARKLGVSVGVVEELASGKRSTPLGRVSVPDRRPAGPQGGLQPTH